MAVSILGIARCARVACLGIVVSVSAVVQQSYAGPPNVGPKPVYQPPTPTPWSPVAQTPSPFISGETPGVPMDFIIVHPNSAFETQIGCLPGQPEGSTMSLPSGFTRSWRVTCAGGYITSTELSYASPNDGYQNYEIRKYELHTINGDQRAIQVELTYDETRAARVGSRGSRRTGVIKGQVVQIARSDFRGERFLGFSTITSSSSLSQTWVNSDLVVTQSAESVLNFTQETNAFPGFGNSTWLLFSGGHRLESTDSLTLAPNDPNNPIIINRIETFSIVPCKYFDDSGFYQPVSPHDAETACEKVDLWD